MLRGKAIQRPVQEMSSRAPSKGRAKRPRRELAFRQEQGLQGHAQPVGGGGGAQRQEAAVEERAARLGRRQAVGHEPSRPAYPLVVALDKPEAQQVARGADLHRQDRRAMRRGDRRSERQDYGLPLRGAAVRPQQRRPVDDVGVELVGGGAREVHASGDAHLQPGTVSQHAAQARRPAIAPRSPARSAAAASVARAPRPRRCRARTRRRRAPRIAPAFLSPRSRGWCASRAGTAWNPAIAQGRGRRGSPRWASGPGPPRRPRRPAEPRAEAAWAGASNQHGPSSPSGANSRLVPAGAARQTLP